MSRFFEFLLSAVRRTFAEASCRTFTEASCSAAFFEPATPSAANSE